MRHIIESQQFDRPLIEQLFRQADTIRLKSRADKRSMARHIDELMYVLFYEPSTRTRFSFETAGQALGMRIVSTENASQFSSAMKGETLEDTIRVLCQYEPAAIVIRHKETGAAERAAAVSTVPIINAGDGTGQHPTQALLDVYTIMRELGRVDNTTVVIGGDLAYGRTARSLAYILTKFTGVKIIFVAPEPLKIGSDIKYYLKRKGVAFSEEERVAPAIKEADIVYWTRIQRERLPIELHGSFDELQRANIISSRELALMKPQARVLHPLPKTAEIAPEVDSDDRAAYFRQAQNGLWIRIALLEWVLAENGSPP